MVKFEQRLFNEEELTQGGMVTVRITLETRNRGLSHLRDLVLFFTFMKFLGKTWENNMFAFFLRLVPNLAWIFYSLLFWNKRISCAIAQISRKFVFQNLIFNYDSFAQTIQVHSVRLWSLSNKRYMRSVWAKSYLSMVKSLLFIFKGSSYVSFESFPTVGQWLIFKTCITTVIEIAVSHGVYAPFLVTFDWCG